MKRTRAQRGRTIPQGQDGFFSNVDESYMDEQGDEEEEEEDEDATKVKKRVPRGKTISLVHKAKKHISFSAIRSMIIRAERGVYIDSSGRLYVQVAKDSDIDGLDTYTIALSQKMPGPFATGKRRGEIVEYGENLDFAETGETITLNDYYSLAPVRDITIVEYLEKIGMSTRVTSALCSST
jgi:hypothetical protein